MADFLPLIANASTLTTPGNIATQVFAQEIEHVVEVSGYDQIDAQFFLYNTVGDTDVKFSLLTSMVRSEKLDGWVSLGEFRPSSVRSRATGASCCPHSTPATAVTSS